MGVMMGMAVGVDIRLEMLKGERVVWKKCLVEATGGTSTEMDVNFYFSFVDSKAVLERERQW